MGACVCACAASTVRQFHFHTSIHIPASDEKCFRRISLYKFMFIILWSELTAVTARNGHGMDSQRSAASVHRRPFYCCCPTIELGIPLEHSIYTSRKLCAFCLFLHRTPSKSGEQVHRQFVRFGSAAMRSRASPPHHHTFAFTCTRRTKTESMAVLQWHLLCAPA